MPPTPSDRPDSEAAVPARLTAAMRAFGADAQGDAPSPGVDEAVSELARSHFAARQSAPQPADRSHSGPAQFWRPRRIAAAAAVWIGIGTGLAVSWARGSFAADSGDVPITAARTHNLRYDVDGDGRVDVRDALRLVQFVRNQVTPDPRWPNLRGDVTGDGQVNALDVDAMLAEVTRL